MRDHYYLDNAATTWPKPERVYTEMDSFFRKYGVNPGRGGHEMAVEAERDGGFLQDERRDCGGGRPLLGRCLGLATAGLIE